MDKIGLNEILSFIMVSMGAVVAIYVNYKNNKIKRLETEKYIRKVQDEANEMDSMSLNDLVDKSNSSRK